MFASLMGAPALFLHPFGAVKEQRSDQPLPVPEELFSKNCQNCHSEKTFWPWYSYVIVSVQEGVPLKMTSWRLKDDRTEYTEETIEVRSEPVVKSGV